MEKRKMTEEEKKLVTDNINLVYWFMHKYNLPIDEWEDILFEKTCIAAMNYDPSVFKFSTYLTKLLYNEMLMKIRTENAKKRFCEDVFSFDEKIKNKKSQNFTLADITSSKDDQIALLITDMAFRHEIEFLSEKERQILFMKMDGKTQREIGKCFNLSQVQVSRILTKIRRRFRENEL